MLLQIPFKNLCLISSLHSSDQKHAMSLFINKENKKRFIILYLEEVYLEGVNHLVETNSDHINISFCMLYSLAFYF